MVGPEGKIGQEAHLSPEDRRATEAYAAKILGSEIIIPTPRDAAREEVLRAIERNAQEAPVTAPVAELAPEVVVATTTREEVSQEVAAALASIRDHEITPPPQPQVMEMPVQPWQGKDQRGKMSKNEREIFDAQVVGKEDDASGEPSPKKASVNAAMAEALAAEVRQANVGKTAPAMQFSETPVPQVPIEAPRAAAEVTPVATAVAPEAEPLEQKPAAPVVSPPQKLARVLRGSNSGPTPAQVEAAAATGKPLEIPKPQPTPVEVAPPVPPVIETVPPVVEAVKPTASPVETKPTPPGGPTLAEKLRVRAEQSRDQHILSNEARAFVTKLYTSKPANAIRALGWRVSINFNNALAAHFDERAREHEKRKAGFDTAVVNLDKKSGDEAADRARLEAQHGKGIFASRAVRDQLKRELKNRADSKKYYEQEGKFQAGEQKINSKRAAGFEKRKQVAIEKLAVYVESRLAPSLQKFEKIQKSKDVIHAEVLKLEGVCEDIDRAKYEVDTALLESADKPRSVQMALAQKSKDLEKAYGSAQSLLNMRTIECANAETRLVTIKQRVDATRDRLMGIRKEADPALAEPTIAAAANIEVAPAAEEVPPFEKLKHQIEAFGDKSETISNMTADEYITSWNALHGSEIPLTSARFVERTGIKAGATLPVEDLDAALRTYVLLAAARKQRGEWFSAKNLKEVSERLEPKLAVFRASLTVKSKV